MRQIPWNRKVLEKFVQESYLTEFEEKVLRTRIEKSWTQRQQAMELKCSLSTINRTVKRLRKLYDEVQKHFPDELPIRTHSDYEDYLDQN